MKRKGWGRCRQHPCVVWETGREGRRTENKIACLSTGPSFPPALPPPLWVLCQTCLSSLLTWGRAKSFTLHHWFTPSEPSWELQNTLWSNFLKGTSIFTNVFHMIKLWNLSPVWQYLREMLWGLERKCLGSALNPRDWSTVDFQGAVTLPQAPAPLVQQQAKARKLWCHNVVMQHHPQWDQEKAVS